MWHRLFWGVFALWLPIVFAQSLCSSIAPQQERFFSVDPALASLSTASPAIAGLTMWRKPIKAPPTKRSHFEEEEDGPLLSLPHSLLAAPLLEPISFAVAYQRSGDDPNQPSGLGVFLQRFTATISTNSSVQPDGPIEREGPELLVNTVTLYDQSSPSMAELGKVTPGYVVVYQSTVALNATSRAARILAQRFDPEGHRLGGEKMVSGDAAGLPRQDTVPVVAYMPPSTRSGTTNPWGGAVTTDGFAVVWIRYPISANGLLGTGNVMLKMYNHDGSARTFETQVNTITKGATAAEVAGLTDGRVVVTWTASQTGCSGTDIMMQVYAPNGFPIGSETIVNGVRSGDQGSSTVTGLADGGFIVGWRTTLQSGASNGLYQQRFNRLGARVGGQTLIPYTANADQTEPFVLGLDRGGWAVAWNDLYNPALAGTSSSGSGSSAVAPTDALTVLQKSFRHDGAPNTRGCIVPANITSGDSTSPSYSSDFMPVMAQASHAHYLVAWTRNNAIVQGALFTAFP